MSRRLDGGDHRRRLDGAGNERRRRLGRRLRGEGAEVPASPAPERVMEPLYSPDGVDERWQRTWEEEGHYAAEPDSARTTFAIAHPPPNVTGDLHLGHALQLSLADTIVRTRRMQGYNVLFQPGYDHAGISTQNAVEKHLAEQGKTRQDLGREAFVAL